MAGRGQQREGGEDQLLSRELPRFRDRSPPLPREGRTSAGETKGRGAKARGKCKGGRRRCNQGCKAPSRLARPPQAWRGEFRFGTHIKSHCCVPPSWWLQTKISGTDGSWGCPSICRRVRNGQSVLTQTGLAFIKAVPTAWISETHPDSSVHWGPTCNPKGGRYTESCPPH